MIDAFSIHFEQIQLHKPTSTTAHCACMKQEERVRVCSSSSDVGENVHKFSFGAQKGATATITIEAGRLVFSFQMKPFILTSMSTFPTLQWSSRRETILGVYQPNEHDNLLKLYYQEYTGPINYLTSNINPPPPSWFAVDTPTTQLYYPLVSAIVSKGNNNTIMI